MAQFRASTGGSLGDTDFDAFVAALLAESSEFTAIWTHHRLAPSPSWEKAIVHPPRGPLRLFYTTVQVIVIVPAYVRCGHPDPA